MKSKGITKPSGSTEEEMNSAYRQWERLFMKGDI
jgi:hypothetical protein